MLIKACKGYELEKAQSNTSEDFFNKSEVTYEEDGKEKTLTILYVRYFDEKMSEFTPYDKEPIFEKNSQAYSFKDIVALVCLLKNPGFRHRKRVYINSQIEFASYYKGIDFEKINDILESLVQNREYKLSSPLEFILNS